jgi:hypothetical protein
MNNSRTKTKKKRTVVCLLCGEDIYIGHNPHIGSRIICDRCDTQFEIVDLDPVLVDWLYHDDFDDDDDIEDDDE